MRRRCRTTTRIALKENIAARRLVHKEPAHILSFQCRSLLARSDTTQRSRAYRRCQSNTSPCHPHGKESISLQACLKSCTQTDLGKDESRTNQRVETAMPLPSLRLQLSSMKGCLTTEPMLDDLILFRHRSCRHESDSPACE